MLSKLDFLGMVKAAVETNRADDAVRGVTPLDSSLLGNVSGGGWGWGSDYDDWDGWVDIGYIDNGQYQHFDTVNGGGFNESGLPFLPDNP